MMINTDIYEYYYDNYNYYNLITKINTGYRLFFNKKNKMFEIINIANNNEICLKFNSFSLELLKNLQKYQSYNADKIFNEIDDFNNKLNEKLIQTQSDKYSQKLLDLHKSKNKICFS